MYCENIITFCYCHNIFTIAEISVPYRSKKKKNIYIYIYMICSQHFYYNFITNSKWQGIIDG